MTKGMAIFGNHSAVRVQRVERDNIRRFYRDVLVRKIMSELDDKDEIQMGDGFYIAFLYESRRICLGQLAGAARSRMRVGPTRASICASKSRPQPAANSHSPTTNIGPTSRPTMSSTNAGFFPS